MTKTVLLSFNIRAMLKDLISPSASQLMKFCYLAFCSALCMIVSCPLQAQYYPAEAKNPQNQTNVNGTWYYTANATQICTNYASGDPENGCITYKYSFELWRSNETPQGTIKIQTYEYYTNSEESFIRYPNAFKAVGNSLFYIGNRHYDSYTLTKIDNNSTVPVSVAVIYPGFKEDLSNYNYNFTAVNNSLFFTTADGGFEDTFGKELWKSDGTTAGTGMVKDIYPGEAGSNPTELRNENGVLYFTATDASGTKLWKSDGTPQGTSATTSPYYPAEAKNPQNETNVNGIVYFTANATEQCISYATGDPNDGCVTFKYSFDLWRSNGTPQGTTKIENYEYYTSLEDEFTRYPNAFKAVGNSLFYIGKRNAYFYTLTKIDNNSTVPVELKSITTGAIGGLINYTYNFTAVNNTLFFTTSNDGFSGDGFGKELWKSDGTTAGTVMVKDIYPGYTSSNPTDLRAENGLLYFMADDEVGTRLWKSDGTAQGTVPVEESPSCVGCGSISREKWTNIEGVAVSAIPLNTTPASIFQLTSFESPTNDGNNYGQRIRGYLHPAVNGSYTFYIAGDDNAELWLSSDEDPVKKVRIAHITGTRSASWTGIRQWDKFPSQKSASIALQAGKKYYIEALHKESLYGDNLAVGWTKPGSSPIEVIPGTNLSPFVPVASMSFYRAINLNGPALTIDGHYYEASSTAPNFKFTGKTFSNQNIALTPSTDAARATMIRSSIYSLSSALASISLSSVPEGEYLVYLYVWEDNTTEVYNLFSGGKLVEANHSSGAAGSWKKLGPYPKVSLGEITFIAYGGAANLSGIEIWQVNSPDRGTISREVWTNIAGTAVSAIPVSTAPTTTGVLTSFETPTNIGDNYGQRIRGYLHPPVSGSYTFFLAGDDNCELYLSTDEDPLKKVKIADITGWTYPREWFKYPSWGKSSQSSVPISLQAGKKYYIEALHKESLGGDNLAVGWDIASDIPIISGKWLSPFLPTSAARLAAEEVSSSFTSEVFPNPFDDKLTIQTQAKGTLQVSLLDALGRNVYQATHQGTEAELVIDLSRAQLKAGMYLLQLQTSDGKRHITRVIKK